MASKPYCLRCGAEKGVKGPCNDSLFPDVYRPTPHRWSKPNASERGQ